MSEPLTLAIIDSPFLSAEFATIAERARAGGLIVQRYPTPAAFYDTTETHAAINIILCMGNWRIGVEHYIKMPNLRAIVCAVTGIEGIDLDASTQHNIVVGNGQTKLNYIGMAEATILLMLSASYDLNYTQQVLQKSLGRPSPLRARQLFGRTIGFVSFGRIAQEIAIRLAPWGVPMLCYTHRPNQRAAELGVKTVALDTLMQDADIISLHSALNADTRHLIDERRLKLMKQTAILVNTARGAIIDEAALIAALQTGQIAGAALDTFEIEPLPLASPLRQIPNVILTPHMVGHTAECNEDVMENAWASIQHVLQGKPPRNVKNPDVIKTWVEKYTAK